MEYNKKNKPAIKLKISDIKLQVIRINDTPQMSMWQDTNDLIAQVHTHLSYEVIFVTRGPLEVRTYETSLFFDRGIVIIPPNLSHVTIPSDEECFCLLFVIEKPKHDNPRAACLNDYLQKGICNFELSDDVDYYIRAFSRKSSENTHSAEKAANLLAELIFREIISRIPSMDMSGDTKSESWCIGAIESYINTHIKEKITLSDVANHVYMSNKLVSRIIMREYKMPLSELITQKKLQIAQALLKKTDKKVKEIATTVNMGMENYFYTIFKKHYGVSPMEYRKMCRESDKQD
ncbi:MAG: helix-turn-helix domain-containing protein [Clostridia bacterium]|nr:helix-turn-helix domain-containing protein [Clostridia bacterium]